LNETTGAVGSVFLGLTIGCAQCHDHKDDPLSQADFYRLRAFFDNAKLPPKNQSLPPVFHENGAFVSGKSILRLRGDFQRNGPVLQPAFVRVVNRGGGAPNIEATTDSSGRRAALAEWMTDPVKNPLFARVIVNRVWQYHFGTGLVATPNDFGIPGARPSHPELLDWLARDLIAHNWSLKHLHRRIILSRAWQQSSLPLRERDSDWEDRKTTDPENRLLSRRVPLRLSGEVIRDCMLAATGDLNPKAGGPGFLPPLPKEVTVTLLKNQWPVTEDPAEHQRRSIYLFARRNLRYPLFELFDRPDANLPCGRRYTSTTAPQSLFLLNSRFSEERASALANQLRNVASVEEQIRLAYRKTVSRTPGKEEVSMGKDFIGKESLEMFCLALFNQNEFVYMD
ncbi:MAG: DUF1553 domain-containing protein, partial [Verrucomicrobiales bacterium]|nr:DUF1553 domain-containing protein [Verrucomicrobiales bacterium]